MNFITLQVPVVLQTRSKQKLELRWRGGNLAYHLYGKVQWNELAEFIYLYEWEVHD